MEQDAERVQDLLRGAYTTREYDDSVADAHECLQALLHVRHDDQRIDDGIGRLGGDDARLRDADVTAVTNALFRVADGRAFHRAFHRARPAARADIHRAQPELVANQLGVVVFLAADCMPAPADNDVQRRGGQQEPGVAHDVEHGVGGPADGGEVEARIPDDLVAREDDVAQHGEQQFTDAADHLAVDEGIGRRTGQRHLYTAVLLDEADFEIPIAL